MKKYSVVFLVLYFSLSFSVSYAEKPLDSLTTEELKDSLKVLNNRLKADYYMFKEGGFKERLEAESKKWEAEATNFKAEVRNENWLVAFIVFACGGISIGLIAIFYTKYKKSLEELVKTQETESKNKLENLFLKYELETNNRIEKLKEEQEQKIRHLDSSFLAAISDLVNSSPENLRKLIHTREEEYKLVRNAEILVISAAKNDGEELRNLFYNYGFDTSKIEYKTIEEYTIEVDKNTSKDKLVNVILFNDENNGLKNNLKNLSDYEKNDETNKRVYFYYGQARLEGFDNSNFANSKFTFYNNFLALLRYKKLMIDTIKK